jgi:hypothetical protein
MIRVDAIWVTTEPMDMRAGTPSLAASPGPHVAD